MAFDRTPPRRVIKLRKAEALPGQVIPDVTITIESVPLDPEAPLTLDQLRRLHQGEAKLIVSFLCSTLPGGTIDALLVELLDRKRSALTVRYPLDDGSENTPGK